MLNIGKRSIFRQGGSFLISLPIQWIRSENPENVKIEMDNEQRIIITPVPVESYRARRTEINTTIWKKVNVMNSITRKDNFFRFRNGQDLLVSKITKFYCSC